ncbi:hypothetical protein BH23ACT5_BH23ACT5_08200 [soil metagenome]
MNTTTNNIGGTETSMASVKDRFGGIDTPASLMGAFTAFGVLVFLGALIAAGAGAADYQLNAFDPEGNVQELVVGGIIMAVLVTFVAFLCGGWAAGRMARYDGGMNGLGTALWALLAVAVFAALGAWAGAEYNAFQRVGMPDWFSQVRGDDVTTLGVIAAVVSVVAVLAGGYIGGKFGEMYHRRADAALADQTVIR